MQIQWESHGGAPLGMFPTVISIQIIQWFLRVKGVWSLGETYLWGRVALWLLGSALCVA